MKIQFVLCYSHIFCKQLLVARTGFPLPFLPRIWVTTFLAVCSCTLILPTPHLFWNWRCRQNIPSKYSNALIRLHLVTNHNTVCKPYRHAYQKSEISHNVLERQVVARTVTDFPYFMEKAKFRYRVHNSPPLVRIMRHLVTTFALEISCCLFWHYMVRAPGYMCVTRTNRCTPFLNLFQ